MTKQEFLTQLERRLSALPETERDASLAYYDEIIDDALEQGMSQAEAVASLGDIDQVVSQILADVPLSKLVKEQVRPKRKIKAWEIVLLILGFPIWGSLLIAAAAVVFSVYICIWAVVICLYAADLALGASAFAMLTCSVVFFALRSPIAALWMLAAALILAGLTILFFLLSNLCAKGTAILGKKIGIGFKKMLIAKERAK